MSNGNDLLMGGGVPWASFAHEGDTISGVVKAEPTSRQSRDMESGDLKTWSDGNPVMEIVVTLATDLRDPEVDFDDGTRQLVINKKNLQVAVRNAVRASGAQGLEVGGLLTVTYTSTDAPTKRGFSGVKNFEAEYEPPTANSALMGDDDEPSEEEALAALQETFGGGKAPAKKAAPAAKKAAPARARR